MRKYLINSSMRLFVLLVSIILWVGIWLTGFDKVHWFLYVIPCFFVFAAITGICPSFIFSRLIIGDKPKGDAARPD